MVVERLVQTEGRNFKICFVSNIQIFLHPQIPDFLILSYYNKPYIKWK